MRILIATILSSLCWPALAAIKLERSADQWISLGIGLRTEVLSQDNAEQDGEGASYDASFDARLLLSAKISKMIGLTFNTGYQDGDIKLLDATAKFAFADEFNLWLGRFLPPTDRSNFSGTYFLNAWVFPTLVQRYPAAFAGRDNGAAVWGMVADKRLKYQIGLFEGLGRTPVTGGDLTLDPPNEDSSPLVAARVTYNFLDKEMGYFNSSTWYGKKHILAIGLVAQTQASAVGNGETTDPSTGLIAVEEDVGDYNAYSIDAIYERPLPRGSAFTLESAYYQYDSEDRDIARQGNGYMIVTGYLLSKEREALGQFQPVFRFQSYDSDLSDETITRTDAQLNYILKGHSARFSMVYANEDYFEGTTKKNLASVAFGTQLLF